MPSQRQLDELARQLRNNRARELQNQQIADQAAAQIRMERRMKEQGEQAIRMKGPRSYEELHDEYMQIERRMEGLTPGGRGGFDDILRENLQERLDAIRAEVDARGVVEELDIDPSIMRQRQPVQQQQARDRRGNDPRDFSRPGERRNKRNFPWLLDDGIHFDKQNVPFKVKDGKIVEFTEEEAAQAAQLANLRGQRALTPEEMENRVTVEQIRQSEEFKRLRQENLERLREEKFNRLSPEEQERVRAEEQARKEAQDEAARQQMEARAAEVEKANITAAKAEKKTKREQKKKDNQAARESKPKNEPTTQSPEDILVDGLSQAIPGPEDFENKSAEAMAQGLVEWYNEINKLVENGNLPEDRAQALVNNYIRAVERSPKGPAIMNLVQGED